MAIQVLKNTGATLQETFSAGAADGTVTVTLTHADGTSAGSGSAIHGTGGVYTFALAPQAELDLLSVVWSGSWSGVAQSITSQVEIVGGLLFSVADARAFGDQTLNDTVKYPDDVIRAARERIADAFEQVCSVAFVPRYARDVLDGNGGYAIRVYHQRCNRVIAASINGVALTSGQLADITARQSGYLIRNSGAWDWSFAGRNVVVAYEHGYPSAPPDIQRAALVLARYELVSNDISDRMIAFDSDLGQVRLSVPGRQYPTGIPIVDATLARYDESSLLVA
jgi:hypothetical protein